MTQKHYQLSHATATILNKLRETTAHQNLTAGKFCAEKNKSTPRLTPSAGPKTKGRKIDYLTRS
jgi:hypothetical protein